jgi:hypothetical protein
MGEMAEKTLDVTSGEELTRKVGDVQVFGDADAWQLICKASSEYQGWMKSTKAMLVPGLGCLVQVSTQQRSADGNTYSVAEAVTFVPGVKIFDVLSDDGKVIGRDLVPFR